MAPSAAAGHVWSAVKALHYTFPFLWFVYFITARAVTVCTLQTHDHNELVRRHVVIGLVFAIAALFAAEGLVSFGYSFNPKTTYFTEDRMVYLISSFLVFFTQGVSLTDYEFPVWYPYYGAWILAIPVELTLTILPNAYLTSNPTFTYIILVNRILRIATFIVLVAIFYFLRNSRKEFDNADAEQQALLGQQITSEAGTLQDSSPGYGTAPNNKAKMTDEAVAKDKVLINHKKKEELVKKRLQQDGNWFTYTMGFSVFVPYVWPTKNRHLQSRIFAVGLCLLANNALNLLVPRQMGIMVNSLTKYNDKDSSQHIWLNVFVYILFQFLSGTACIGLLREWLWLPVENYSYEKIMTASHGHIMNLSSEFHESRNAMELVQSVQGGRSVSALLQTICFSIAPMAVDLATAFVYLWMLFGPYMGLTILTTAVLYLYASTTLVSKIQHKRRNFTVMWRRQWTTSSSSIEGQDNAMLFNRIPYEQDNYAGTVDDHLRTYSGWTISQQGIIAIQSFIMTTGLLAALWVGVYQVAFCDLSVGSFTTLIMYWAQLAAPLNVFSSMFKRISESLMDAEKLLDILQTEPTVAESPNAKRLKLKHGLVEFKNVSFAYDDRKKALNDISFCVPAGKTTAIVGQTGGGKSTILKLIDRYYDINAGSITIDGQDIRDVQLSSLRQAIGIVPQEPKLFDDTIMANIRYASPDASDEDVYDACKAAAIHDQIMGFPDKYNSKVGDKGVKVSGGEKQRLAIARAILKRAEIILLDEATSAIDSETERLVQEGLKALCSGRTTFIVAHRLSTIKHADHIIVIKKGEIVEQGSHNDLLASRGKYHQLWTMQSFSSDETDTQTDGQSTETANDSIGDNESESAIEEDATEDGGNQDGGNNKAAHRREGSKLKADAPEFIPSQFRVDPRDNSTVRPTPKETAKAQKKLAKEEKKATSLGKKADKKANFDTADLNIEGETAATGLSDANLMEAAGPTVEKSKSKRLRASRRHATKSEPEPNRLLESHDGAQDSDMAATSSGEGQPLLQAPSFQRRRVSAPSDPPSGTQKIVKNRTQHWRTKPKNRQGSGSGLISAIDSSTYDTSADDTVSAAPVTSPVAGVSQTSSSVRFAAGF